jgi:hypothetical protein
LTKIDLGAGRCSVVPRPVVVRQSVVTEKLVGEPARRNEQAEESGRQEYREQHVLIVEVIDARRQ